MTVLISRGHFYFPACSPPVALCQACAGSEAEQPSCRRMDLPAGTLAAGEGGKHETRERRWLPTPVLLKDLDILLKAFSFLPSPSLWGEIKNLCGILKEELTPSFIVLGSGPCWLGATLTQRLHQEERFEGSLRATFSLLWSTRKSSRVIRLGCYWES